MALLERVAFDAAKDRVWLVGDLVNRGPDSLAVLRWAREREGAVFAVLGNHDIHLLARAQGLLPVKKRDTLDAVLTAPDAPRLLAWLTERPIMHRERVNGAPFVLLHAGLLPGWTIKFAETLARGIEAELARGGLPAMTAARRAAPDLVFREDLTGPDRHAAALRVLTNVRMVAASGAADFTWSGPPREAPPGHAPWYAARAGAAAARGEANETIIFGHWSALGFHRAPGAVCLDSGCVWGHFLTAYRLDDGAVFQMPCREDLSGMATADD